MDKPLSTQRSKPPPSRLKRPSKVFSSSITEEQKTVESVYRRLPGSTLKSATPTLPRPKTQSVSTRRSQSGLDPVLTEVRKSVSRAGKLTNVFRTGESRVSVVSTLSIAGESENLPKDHNQDASISLQSFCSSDRSHLFAIFDGHGEDGHLLTAYLRDAVPKLLEPAVQSVLTGQSDISALRGQLADLFPKLQRDMCQDLPLDSDLSGSTAVVTVIVDDVLLCGSVGDSRAVLGCKGSPWRLIPLTRDHRPESPTESERILSKGGRIEPNYDEERLPVGSPRVWLPTENVPGLAMSRSLGDALVHRYGVSPEADITVRQLRPWDRILLLASDGIWSYITNEEALQVAGRNYPKRKAVDTCEHLYREAAKRWRANSSRVDDITVVTVFFN